MPRRLAHIPHIQCVRAACHNYNSKDSYLSKSLGNAPSIALQGAVIFLLLLGFLAPDCDYAKVEYPNGKFHLFTLSSTRLSQDNWISVRLVHDRFRIGFSYPVRVLRAVDNEALDALESIYRD